MAPMDSLYRIFSRKNNDGYLEVIPHVFLAMCNERRDFPHLLTNLASCGSLPGSREEIEMV